VLVDGKSWKVKEEIIGEIVRINAPDAKRVNPVFLHSQRTIENQSALRLFTSGLRVMSGARLKICTSVH
jgi:hypothetical protein